MKYAIDTNVFIEAFRTAAAEEALVRFIERALPVTFMSAVVMQELAAGARTRQQSRILERLIFRPFERRGRVFAPSTAAFVRSGRLIAALGAREGRSKGDHHSSLLNDALMAESCRERGITLVTWDKDFARLQPFLRGWRTAAPWPQVRA